MSSRRLPGKMLRDISGRDLLSWVVLRVRRAQTAGEIVVATSDDSSDDALARRAEELGVSVARGSLENVAMRLCETVRSRGFHSFVRICGDSPCIDPALIDRAVRLFEAARPDILSNTLKRSFPKGQSIEILKGEVFCRACLAFKTPEHQEHVMSYFYEHPEGFAIESLLSDTDHSAVNMCIDTEADLVRISSLISGLGEESFLASSWKDLLPHFRGAL